MGEFVFLLGYFTFWSGGGKFSEVGDLFFFFGGDESLLFGENKAYMAEPSDQPAISDGTNKAKWNIWDRHCPETHLIRCSAGATLYKVSDIYHCLRQERTWHLQCGSDEPSWTWTQICVQARVLNQSLNKTTRSSAIQGWQRWQWCSSATQRWPSRGLGPFALKFEMKHWLSGKNAKQSNEKASTRSSCWSSLYFV